MGVHGGHETEKNAPADSSVNVLTSWKSSRDPDASASSLYLAGVSRYPLDEAKVVLVWLVSGYDGSQPRFLDVGSGAKDDDDADG
jgi:hypothetical protein